MDAPRSASPLNRDGPRPGGAMRARLEAHDWSKTPLGPAAAWPQSLRSTVKTLLASRYPMVLTWGPEFTQIYNDAYATVIGDKHPGALGVDIRETLAEAWGTLGPMIERVMTTGEASWVPALLLPLDRAGYREEAYFSVSHAPAEDDEGRVAGMLAVCSEVTEQVLGERRLRLLRDLGARAGEALSVERACGRLAEVLREHPLDVPFTLAFLRDRGAAEPRLRAAVGVEGAGPGAPWPLARALAGEAVLVRGAGGGRGAGPGATRSATRSCCRSWRPAGARRRGRSCWG